MKVSSPEPYDHFISSSDFLFEFVHSKKICVTSNKNNKKIKRQTPESTLNKIESVSESRSIGVREKRERKNNCESISLRKDKK